MYKQTNKKKERVPRAVQWYIVHVVIYQYPIISKEMDSSLTILCIYMNVVLSVVWIVQDHHTEETIQHPANRIGRCWEDGAVRSCNVHVNYIHICHH